MNDRKTVSPKEARQGRKGYQVLVILIASLLLVLVVWWGVGLFGQAIEPEEPVGGVPAEQPIEAPEGGPSPVQ